MRKTRRKRIKTPLITDYKWWWEMNEGRGGTVIADDESTVLTDYAKARMYPAAYMTSWVMGCDGWKKREASA